MLTATRHLHVLVITAFTTCAYRDSADGRSLGLRPIRVLIPDAVRLYPEGLARIISGAEALKVVESASIHGLACVLADTRTSGALDRITYANGSSCWGIRSRRSS